jgi:hypothetical protein
VLVAKIPYIGYITLGLQGPAGMVLIALLIVLMVGFEYYDSRKERSRSKQVIEPSDLICQHCGFVNPKGHRYCGSCGYPLTPEGTRVY